MYANQCHGPTSGPECPRTRENFWYFVPDPGRWGVVWGPAPVENDARQLRYEAHGQLLQLNDNERLRGQGRELGRREVQKVHRQLGFIGAAGSSRL